MNGIQMTLKTIVSVMKRAKHWEIKDSMFFNVIADENSGNFEDAMLNIQEEFANQPIIVKAGTRDKNGKLSNNSKTFNFTMPATGGGEEFNLVISPHTQQTTFNGLAGTQTVLNGKPIQQQDLGALVAEMETRLSTKFENDFKKRAWEIEETYRRMELERKEKELEEKILQVQLKEVEYSEKVEKFVPEMKDVLNGLFDFTKTLIKGKSVSGLHEDEDEEEEEEIEKGSKIKFSIEKIEKKETEVTEEQKGENIEEKQEIDGNQI